MNPRIPQIAPLDPRQIPSKSAEMIEALRKRFDVAGDEDLSLEPGVRLAIALRTAELLACPFNVARYASAARETGLPDREVRNLRCGRSGELKEQALLALTTKLVRDHGQNTRLVLDVARELGITHAEILELVTIVASVTYTSYLAGVLGR